jgi:ATP/maltotriose-dependent transcriptional regulator MalT
MNIVPVNTRVRSFQRWRDVQAVLLRYGFDILLALVVAICQLAETQAMQGHLSQAFVTLQKARFVAPELDENPLVGIVDIEVGEILRERDLLEEAKEYLERFVCPFISVK